MSTDNDQLALVLAEKDKRNNSPDIISKVVSEIKSSVVFQYNWEELLMSAPVAINCLGGCFVASSSPVASTTILTAPKGGFKFLPYTSLRANLVECGNVGRNAFLTAEINMGKVRQTSVVIFNKCADIVDCLNDPPSAKKLLKSQMSTLKTAADSCQYAAVEMDQKFDFWLQYVCEFHAACVQTSSDTQGQLMANEINLIAQQTRLDYQKVAVEDARKTTDQLSKQMETANQAFKKASDDFPTGWDIIGQQIVGDLAASVASALNQAIPVLVMNMNPVAQAAGGSQMIGGTIGQGAGNINDIVRNNDKTSKPATGEAGAPVTTPAPRPPVAPMPQNAQDPAYTQVTKDMTYIELLKVILFGSDGGIDWGKARGDNGKEGAKSSISFIKQMMDDSRSSFSALATAQEPSRTYSTVLATIAAICAAVENEVTKSKDVSYSPPEKSSEVVKKWQTDFNEQYKASIGLQAVAKTLPGTAANGMPTLASGPDPSTQAAQANAKTAQAQAILESAKNRLATTQQAFVATQELYQKSAQILIDTEEKMGLVKADLARLSKENMSLEEIKQVLFQCVKLIITMKEQISNLVKFFKAISRTIEVAIQLTVEPFLRELAASVAEDGTDPEKVLKIGNFTFSDFQRSAIFQSIITIRAYFGVFGDIASMWVKMSTKNIQPGLALVDQLGIEDKSSMVKKSKDLSDWASAASTSIRSMAAENRMKIEGDMESRVGEIATQTKYLQPTPEVKKAIESAASQAKAEILNTMVTQAEQKPITKYSMSRDLDDF